MRATVLLLAWLAGCGFSIAANDPDGGTGPLDDGNGDASIDAVGPPGDADGDGTPDATDNCRDVANANQADEDGDGIGNVCDNCPHVANPTQANVLESNNGQQADTVGDVCDPRPTMAGQSIALFMPFDSATELAGWMSAGGGSTFTVSQGRLVHDATADLAIFWRNGLGFADAWITTEVTYLAIDNAQRWRGAGLMTRFQRQTDFGTGGGCGEVRDTMDNSSAPMFNTLTFGGGGFSTIAVATGAMVDVGHVATYTVHGAAGNNIDCVIGSYTNTVAIGAQTGTGINLAIWGARVSFRYLVVIQ